MPRKSSSATGGRLTIAQFTDNYGPAHSGILYAVQFLEEQALAAGYRTLLVAPVANGPNPLAGHPDRREIRLPSVSVPGMNVRLATGRDFDYRLAQLVENPPDLIHVHGLGPVGLLGLWVAERTKTPLLVTWHTDFEAYAEHYWHLAPMLNAAYKLHALHQADNTWAALRKFRPSRPRRGGAQVELLQVASAMLTKADLVTTPSSKTGRRVLEIAPDARVLVAPNGVDPLPPLAPISRPSGLRVLYVGRLSAEKGLTLLLDAFELLRDHLPTAELMIVGDWRHTQARLRRRLRDAGRAGKVSLTGPIRRDRLGAYYSAADIFAFASQSDTQALVLHEAAHAGLPFVSVDDELDLVFEPGVNTIFARSNPVSLANALAAMAARLEDPGFAAVAQQRSRELAARWTVSSQAQQMMQVYAALCDGQPVELSAELQPDHSRRLFPTRTVTAEFRPEQSAHHREEQPR